MKKNFKFMLVGLLAMIGMNAFAITVDENGRSVNDVVYQLITLDDGTKIAYVTQVNPSQTDDDAVKSLEIVSEVAGEHGTYNVVGIFAGWETAGKDVSTITETLSIDAANFGPGALSTNFSGLKALKNLTITDNGATDPADFAVQAFPTFYDKTIVETVDISTCGGVDEVPAYAFENGSLKSIALPESIETIGAFAFKKCTDLATINFPDALTNIGSAAFYYTAITEADLTKTGITKIEASTFEGTQLTSFTVPVAVKRIKSNAFNECYKLATVVFEGAEDGTSALQEIQDYAFSYTKIADITIPRGYVWSSAFEYCTKLKTVQFVFADYANGDNIDPYAFEGCIPTITISTPKEFIADWQADWGMTYPGIIAPENCQWVEKAAPVQVDGTIAFNAGGFAKWYNDGMDIMVDATKYKAFSVFVDNGFKNGDGTAYFQGLKKWDQRYYIRAGEHVIFQKIVTDEEDPASAGVDYEELTYWPGDYSVNDDDIFTFAANTNIKKWHDGAVKGLDRWSGNVWWDSSMYLYRLTANYGVGFSVFTGTEMKGGCYATGDSDAAQFFIQSVRVPNKDGRLNVVWLDENGNEIKGNTTGIESVKASVEDGAAYNLAGQKVNANYKGVVIKNGKKYMK